MTQWAEVHAELRNKIRWALRTCAPKAGQTLPYSDATEWASQLATTITEEWRALAAPAGSVASTGVTRSRKKSVRVSKQWLLANS